MLRAMASTDPEIASRGHYDFAGAVFHQGSIYSASAPSVRFLVELGRGAPHDRVGAVLTAGMMADPAHAHGDDERTVLVALAAEADGLIALLDDPDPGMRDAVVYALTQVADDDAVRALRQRRESERVPLVRAALLLAFAQLDPPAIADEVRAALRDDDPTVRLLAATALARARLPWTAGDIEEFTRRHDAAADALVPVWWLKFGYALTNVIMPLAAPTAHAVLARLATHADWRVRDGVANALEEWFDERGEPDELLGLVERLRSDPHARIRADAEGILRRLGGPHRPHRA
jgi:HEAT repeat protein